MGCSCNCSDEVKFVKAELNIPMHCQGCEKTVLSILFKFEGVESVKSSFSTQKVVVTGRIDLPKLVKRIKMKTGKTAEVAEVIKDDADTATAEPAFIHGCDCYVCRRKDQAFIHGCDCYVCRRQDHGYVMPSYMYDRMGMHYGIPVVDNDYSYCSIM